LYTNFPGVRTFSIPTRLQVRNIEIRIAATAAGRVVAAAIRRASRLVAGHFVNHRLVARRDPFYNEHVTSNGGDELAGD